MKAKNQKPKTKSRAASARSYTLSAAGVDQRSAAGSVTSSRKTRAVRANGRLGGRPGNPEIKRIMQKLGVSRQRAWQILKEK